MIWEIKDERNSRIYAVTQEKVAGGVPAHEACAYTYCGGDGGVLVELVKTIVYLDPEAEFCNDTPARFVEALEKERAK